MTADTASPANEKDAAKARDNLMRFMREKFKDLFKDTKNPLFTLTGAPELVSEYLGFAGIAAGTMDYLGLDAALDRALPPEDAPGSIPGSALLRALVTELLSADPAPDPMYRGFRCPDNGFPGAFLLPYPKTSWQ
jgi:hypothetical protein